MNNTSPLTVGDLLDTLAAVDRDVPVFVGSDADADAYRHSYYPSLVSVVEEAPGEYRDATRLDSPVTIQAAVFIGTVREGE